MYWRSGFGAGLRSLDLPFVFRTWVFPGNRNPDVLRRGLVPNSPLKSHLASWFWEASVLSWQTGYNFPFERTLIPAFESEMVPHGNDSISSGKHDCWRIGRIAFRFRYGGDRRYDTTVDRGLSIDALYAGPHGLYRAGRHGDRCDDGRGAGAADRRARGAAHYGGPLLDFRAGVRLRLVVALVDGLSFDWRVGHRWVIGSGPGVYCGAGTCQDAGPHGGAFQINVVVGVLLAYLSNYVITTFQLGDLQWRWAAWGSGGALADLPAHVVPDSPQLALAGHAEPDR